jgi:symplekin
MIKSMGKTTRLLLIHLSKRDPHNPMVPRIHQHVERMMRMIAEALDETSRKRTLEAQQQDGIDAKRQRTDISQVQIPPLGPGPHTLADVFSLTTTAGLKSFDLSQLPAPLIAKMAVNTLSRIDAQLLNKAITAVRERLDTIASAATQEINPNTAPLGVDEDEDDDYEPDFFQAEDTEQILNKLDIDPKSSVGMISRAEDALGQKSLNLPEPQALTPEMALSAGNGIVARVMEAMRTLDEHSAKKSKSGFKRFAASSGLRDSWVTILARLAMRPSVAEQITVKGEEAAPSKSLRDHIRDVLFNYIMEDFRKHIDMAVSWLCEEWFNDRIQEKIFANRIQGESGEEQPARCEKHYEKCALRLIDGFLPYLHPQDKILTRFLSEIPELNQTILSRVKDMCKDPSVVQLALTSLLYLVMMRPPAKEIALDTVFNIWEDCKLSIPSLFQGPNT